MKEFDIIKAKVSILEKNLKSNKETMEVLKKEIELTSKTKEFLIAFSEYSRSNIKDKLETLANTALKAIYQDTQIIFKIIPDRNKRGLYYNNYLETDGILTPLEDASGGGVYDVVSLSLRISFLKMFEGSLRQTMILDEPFKNLDVDRVKLAVEWLKVVSKQLNIQFIIVTHIETLIENADRGFLFNKVDGETKVVVK